MYQKLKRWQELTNFQGVHMTHLRFEWVAAELNTSRMKHCIAHASSNLQATPADRSNSVMVCLPELPEFLNSKKKHLL